MPCCGEISEIGRIGAEELSVEWTIRRFFALKFPKYDSPRFQFCDECWCLRMYPIKNFKGPNPLSGWLRLVLIRDTKGPPKTFKISVGIKGSSGVEMLREVEKEFSNDDLHCDWEEFCWRYELKEHKTRLMPNSNLTITCVIKMSGTTRVSFPARHGSVIRSLKAILAEGRRADFTLKSGGREWPVHRAILENRSGHFATLLRGEWAERDEAQFEDVTEGALDGVLHFMYAGEVGDMSVENVCGIYVAAHDFLLEDLKSLCVEYMKEKMCPENVCGALAIAETYGEGDLKESARFFMYAVEVGDMSVENVCGIYVAAHDFLKEDLKSLCVEYMKEKMCPEMVCGALAIAETYGEGDLKERALECFFRESKRTRATEGWKNLKKNHPQIVGELFEEFIKREKKKKEKRIKLVLLGE